MNNIENKGAKKVNANEVVSEDVDRWCNLPVTNSGSKINTTFKARGYMNYCFITVLFSP